MFKLKFRTFGKNYKNWQAMCNLHNKKHKELWTI